MSIARPPNDFNFEFLEYLNFIEKQQLHFVAEMESNILSRVNKIIIIILCYNNIYYSLGL